MGNHPGHLYDRQRGSEDSSGPSSEPHSGPGTNTNVHLMAEQADEEERGAGGIRGRRPLLKRVSMPVPTIRTTDFDAESGSGGGAHAQNQQQQLIQNRKDNNRRHSEGNSRYENNRHLLGDPSFAPIRERSHERPRKNSASSGERRSGSVERGAHTVRDVLREAASALRSKSPSASRRISGHFKKPSLDMNSFFGGGGSGFNRARRPSDDHGPQMKSADGDIPVIPPDQVYDPSKQAAQSGAGGPAGSSPSSRADPELAPRPRVRARTIGTGHAARRQGVEADIAAAAAAARRRKTTLLSKHNQEHKLIPTVFKCSGELLKDQEGRVFVAGTMTNWRALEMSKPKGEKDFIVIADCPDGKVFFKFFSDGGWRHDPKQETFTRKEDGVTWNMVTVSKSDVDVFEALACDSFSLKDSRMDSGHLNDEDRRLGGTWSQEKPKENFMASVARKGPPILPPHLLQVLLNKDASEFCDPVLLPEPSHVTLDHLYAQSIRDDMLVMSSTSRYRKKSVTVILYRPI